MSKYYIELTLLNGTTYSGIREIHIDDINKAWGHFKKLADKAADGWDNILYFDCMMIADRSPHLWKGQGPRYPKPGQ